MAASTPRVRLRQARIAELRDRLEALYRRLNRPAYIVPDPLQLVLDYADPGDREVAAWIAASISYGRVASILKSARRILEPMGASPAAFLRAATSKDMNRVCAGWRHRWSKEEEMRAMLEGLRRVLQAHGSLERCFHAGQPASAENSLPGITALCREISVRSSLAPDPSAGGACKRVHMFLRWMVRADAVDPGGWKVSPGLLLMPLDVHSFGMCRRLRLTHRRQPDARAMLEITANFSRISPGDPVKYDFSLTRIGIRPGNEGEETLFS